MKKHWNTKLIHSDASVPEGFRSLATPVYRGSTLLFPNAESVNDNWNQHEVGYTYGLYGTPTTLELAARIGELEHGGHTIITPGGQSALSLINLAFLKAGDHVLIPESLYGPSQTRHRTAGALWRGMERIRSAHRFRHSARAAKKSMNDRIESGQIRHGLECAACASAIQENFLANETPSFKTKFAPESL